LSFGPHDPTRKLGGIPVEILGQVHRLHSEADPELLAKSIARLERTFRDMEAAFELKWGRTPKGLDSSTWLLLGALNLAHQAERLELEANRHTQNLELTLSLLNDDVPDELPAPSGSPQGLFSGGPT
jgi:hypothetical protein